MIVRFDQHDSFCVAEASVVPIWENVACADASPCVAVQ